MVFNPKSSKIAPSTALEPTTFLHYPATAQSIPGQRGVMFGVRGHNVWLDNKDSRCNAGSLRVTTQKLHLDKTFQLSRGEKKKTLLKILGFLFSSHFSSAIKRLSKTCFFCDISVNSGPGQKLRRPAWSHAGFCDGAHTQKYNTNTAA